ncbi:MAG: hypothetical protein P9X22_05060 [Candidatus Zapsychrus exili]|nr:hypothetical protein [Candidatus Zapsychrus exili]
MAYQKSYGKYTYAGYNKKSKTSDAGNYRVKSPVKSFRDLEVYKQTTFLSSEVYRLSKYFERDSFVSNIIQSEPMASNAASERLIQVDKSFLNEEWQYLKETSRKIPVWITESYNDKFTDIKLALDKLEGAVNSISLMVSRFDFILACLNDDSTDTKALRERILSVITNYNRQKIKILNLKKAWARVFSKSEK